MHVLLVEDDELLGDGVRTALLQLEYIVSWVKDGQAALQAILSNSFDTVVLDLGLPKRSGLEVLRLMRAKKINTPVLILTANDGVGSRVNGLDAGADDYLVKPFDLGELCARIRALYRRTSPHTGHLLTHQGLTVDTIARVAYVGGDSLVLSRREFILLQKLLENPGRVLSREQLNQSIYSWGDEVDSNTLEVHIHNLRRKVGFPLVRTIRGVGYMIEKSV